MKKTAIIVTVHNSENCGSFLQAYAMQKTLCDLGYVVAFLYRDPAKTSHDGKRCIRSIYRNLTYLHFHKAKTIFLQWMHYERLQRNHFKVVTANSEFARKVDLVVLGSDTIWNFEDPYFKNTADRLLGFPLKGKHIISYAASLGNTSEQVFRSVVMKHGGLDHIKSLLVRDSSTKNVIKNSFQRESQLVCDPTLLLSSSDYDSLGNTLKIEESFLLLYYFGEVPTQIKDEVILYAQQHNLKIVSLLYRRSWCDVFVPSSPVNMVSCYRKAVAIITNTFHGCALSLIFQKPFAVHEEGKIKVKELLETYSASEHLFSDVKKMSSLLGCSINNKELVEAISKESIQRLKEVVQ